MRIILLLFCALLLPRTAFCEATFNDKIIASSFKSMAKAFVLVVDMEKLKAANIKKLKKMDEEKFEKKYSQAYPFLEKLPPKLKARYGIAEKMSRKQAIINTQNMSKSQAYAIIDMVPDELIAGQFKHFLRQRKQDLSKINLAEEVKKFWEKVIEKAQK